MFFYRLFLISIMFITVSCASVVDKPDKKNIIPEKKLVSIITEIQLTNSLLSNYAVQDWVEKIDSTTTYHYIAEKYGYTKEALDKTLHYYYLKKPKKLIKVYEKMLANLSEMEALLDKQIKIENERIANIWTGEKNYYYPVSIEKSCFEITFLGNAPYLLKFTATLFPDDQSINAKAKMFVVRADSVLTGTRTYFETPNYIKDGRPHEYEINITVGQYRNMVLKGSLYDVANNVNEQQRHVSFENIGLRNLSIR